MMTSAMITLAVWALAAIVLGILTGHFIGIGSDSDAPLWPDGRPERMTDEQRERVLRDLATWRGDYDE